FNERLEQLLASQPSMHTVPLPTVRRVRREGGGIFPPPVFVPHARAVTIAGRAGEIGLRVIAPTGAAKGAYLHLHGGGWALGAADYQDVALAALAEATGLCAVSVEYRLAPEDPFPAAPDDCEDAARWLVERGAEALGVPRRLTIGGESAGAHLAALTLLRLRDRRGISGAFVAANLVYGAFDLSKSPSVRRWGDRNLVLSNPIVDCFNDAFLPGLDLEARRAPDVSPLYADLRDLPPALFTVGTLDPLLDDSLFMEARWRAAGGRTELRVWPDAVHGFNSFPIAMAHAANEAQHRFLAASVASGA
ncbi:MAG: alpha/beta hydrolase, partial [Polyangiales bacterium]